MTGTKQVSIHGKRVYVSPHDEVVARGGLASGGDDKPLINVPGSDAVVSMFEDFLDADTGMLGLDGENGWVKLGDTGGTITFPVTTNGIARLTVTGNGVAAIASATQLSHQLRWKMHQGSGNSATGRVPLRMGARVKMSGHQDTGGRVNAFIGFTDVATIEHPIRDTGAGPVSPANDAVGFTIGEKATQDTGNYKYNWNGAAVNATVVATSVTLDTGPTVNVWDVLEVELHSGISDTGGTATFYVNGVAQGTIASPVTGTVAMTPTVSIFSADTGGEQIIDVDWISVSGPRDTGE